MTPLVLFLHNISAVRSHKAGPPVQFAYLNSQPSSSFAAVKLTPPNAVKSSWTDAKAVVDLLLHSSKQSSPAFYVRVIEQKCAHVTGSLGRPGNSLSC